MADTEAQIAAQGEKIRQLKASKAAKEAIEPEVKVLLALKAKYKVPYSLQFIRVTWISRVDPLVPAPEWILIDVYDDLVVTLLFNKNKPKEIPMRKEREISLPGKFFIIVFAMF